MSKKVRLNRAKWTEGCGRAVGEFMLAVGEHTMAEVVTPADRTAQAYYTEVTAALLDMIDLGSKMSFYPPLRLWLMTMQDVLYLESFYARKSDGGSTGEAHASGRASVKLLQKQAQALLLLSKDEMFEVVEVEEDDEPEGDDLCDFCMRSGVEIERTIEGKTACADCSAEYERGAAEELAIDVNSYVQTYGGVETRLLWALFLRSAGLEGAMR